MKRMFLVLMMLMLFMPAVYAEDSTQEYEISGESFYNRKTREIVTGKLDLNPINIINGFADDIFTEINETKSMLKSILIIAAASGILRVLSESFGGGAASAAFFACFLMITGSAVKIFSEAVGYGVEIIHALCGFITKFEPVFIGFLVSSGAVTQAAAFSPVMTSSIYILSVIVDKCVLPLTYFSAVLGIVNNLGNRIEIGTLNSLIKSVSKWILTGVLTLFSAVLTLYGISTSSLNNLTTKGIKFAVGSFVPVVGGLLSDSIDTVLSGARLMKNAVGTAGMITVVSMSCIPIIKIWIMFMMLRVTAAFCEPFSDKHITGVLLSVADSVQTIFSMVITAVMLFIISIGIILTSTGVGL